MSDCSNLCLQRQLAHRTSWGDPRDPAERLGTDARYHRDQWCLEQRPRRRRASSVHQRRLQQPLQAVAVPPVLQVQDTIPPRHLAARCFLEHRAGRAVQPRAWNGLLRRRLSVAAWPLPVVPVLIACDVRTAHPAPVSITDTVPEPWWDCKTYGTSLCQVDLESGVVGSVPTGSGSDLSEEPAAGVEPVALDVRGAPVCPPGPVAARLRASRMSWR